MMFSSDKAASDYIIRCGGNATELPDDFGTIHPSDGAPKDFVKWKFSPMYKFDTHGNKRVWQIGFDGISSWTLYGTLAATTIVTDVIILTTSSKTLSDQAFIYCNRDYLLKYKDGYQFPGDTRPRHVKGMKGNHYKRGTTRVKFPMVLDIKLDGARALCNKLDGKANLLSNGNITLNYITHIREQLDDLLAFLPRGCTTDGELYKHGMNIREIQSVTRSNVNIKLDLRQISYYIFDLVCDMGDSLEMRYTKLVKGYNAYVNTIKYKTMIKILPKWYAWSEADIETGFSFAVSLGFEGIVMRHSAIGRQEGTKAYNMSKYRFKRSTALLKYKKWYDAEGVVVEIRDTKGKEKDLCKLVVITDVGYLLPVRFGSADEKAAWKKNPETVLGKVLKYKYTDINEDTGIPQRTAGICFRELHTM